MANKEYFESEMKFVFDEDMVCCLEKEPFYKNTECVKVCDFVSLTTKKAGSILCFIEAKKSAPKQLREYVDVVHDKFCHSLFLYIGAIFNRHRHPSANMSDQMRARNNLELPAYCVLVVKKHKKEWLPPVQDALKREMRS